MNKRTKGGHETINFETFPLHFELLADAAFIVAPSAGWLSINQSPAATIPQFNFCAYFFVVLVLSFYLHRIKASTWKTCLFEILVDTLRRAR